ncbi:MAG: DegT/DnrJ/EryC1/StrS aminotransferase family protein [Coriobacteriia bacterium]|nr:DegT/DnrJ/EryC1/StrS aminotransferase family protein [Coriobacteriia bacterium]
MKSRWPVFAADEIAAATRVLESGRVNYWTGDEGRVFETEFARYVGAGHAVAVANGTVALELALEALGIGGPDVEVVVPARTFIGTATAVVARGARPVMADVDRDSGNVTAGTLRDALTPATRALIVVHLGGWPCDMDAVMALAAEHGLVVIEDCAQAHGARWRGRHVGSIGHVGAFSFCQDKIMTTAGEGGMLVTSDPALWQRAWEYKDHGRSIELGEAAEAAGGYEFKYVQGSFGTNWRMSEVQSAVGRVQLGKLDEWVAARRRNAAVLDGALAEVPGLRVVLPGEGVEHAYYKYYAYVRPEALGSGWTRDRILGEVNARGVPVLQGACPEIYLQPAFVDAGLAPAERLPVARELGETSLMLQVDQTLSEDDMLEAASVIAEVMRAATG